MVTNVKVRVTFLIENWVNVPLNVRVFELAKHLDKLGIRSDIYSLGLNLLSSPIPKIVKPNYVIYNDVRVRLIPNVYLGWRLGTFLAGCLLAGTLADGVIIVKHPLIARVLHNINRRYILDYEDVLSVLNYSRRQFRDYYRNLRLEKFAYKNADLIITENDYLARYISSICDDAIVDVIPNGVDLRLFSPDVVNVRPLFAGERVVLGFVGKSVSLERTSIFFKCLKYVSERNRNKMEVLLVGPFNSSAYRLIRKYIRQVNITGYVPHPDVPRFIGMMDICLNPRIDFYFSRSTKNLEYAAMGRPIVATDVPSNSFVKESSCGLLSKPSAEDFAKCIETLIEDPNLAVDLAKNGLRAVKNFDWRVLAEKYKSLLMKSSLV
jgi:glycosyltransferase involved in cell wall biosynthesis